MKALILDNGGFATARPESAQLQDMHDFVTFGEIDKPEPAEGQVLVKVTLASVNPSDEMFIQGLYGLKRTAGKAAGFEAVGVVEASGGGKLADGLVGQRVAFAASPQGTWAEYCLAEAATCIPLIDGVRDEDGAAMIVNPLTAIAMFDLVKQEGEKSFILSAAASQLCKLMISMAKDEGYAPIALVRRADQIDLLKKVGAAHVLDITSPDFQSDLRALCRNEKPRIFLDAVANNLSASVFNAMGKGARWIIYGKLDDELPTIQEPGQMIFMNKRIEGFWLTKWMVEGDMGTKMEAIRKAQMRFASGEWQTDVTAVLSLEEAMERLPQELSKPNGKVFLRP